LDYIMSNNNDTGFQIDAEAFGLPTGVNGDTTPGFMYEDGDLSVDEDDPIYQATVEAMKARGIEIPRPGEEERPPELRPASDDSAADDDAPPSPGDDAAAGADGDEPPAPAAAPDSATVNTDELVEGADDDDQQTPTLALQVDGQDFTLNPAQAEYLLRVNTWLETLPDEVKVQWAGIEQGTHVAISAEEYQRLQQQAAGAKPTQIPSPRVPDLDDLDDDTAEYIRSLEARIPQQQPGGQQDAPPQVDPAELQAAFRHQEEQRTQMMQELATTNEAVAKKYNLTDEQLTHLEGVTANLQVIPTIRRQLTQFGPLGQVVREPAFSEVVERAYEIAMSQDPTLRQIRDEMIYNARVAKTADLNRATNAKKAKAGTLASTPSAAVPANGNGTPSIGPGNKMDLNATSEAIAKALAQMSEQS
jgi:hypothetical protein